MTSTTTPQVYDGLIHNDPGLPHLSIPHTMTRDEETALLQDARTRRTKLLESDLDSSWYSRGSYGGVTVTARKDEDNPFCMTKGTTEAPSGMTLDAIASQFRLDYSTPAFVLRLFHRIDPMNKHMTTVMELQNRDLLEAKEDIRILWGSFYVNPIVSDRDFCIVNHTSKTTCPVTQQPIFCSNTYSIELPNSVPDLYQATGRVRGVVQLTGYIFRPQNNNTDNSNPSNANLSMTFIGQCDPKGFLPAAVVNFVSVKQATNIGRMKESYQHFTNVVHDMMGMKDYVPVCWYSLPRRGGGAIHKVIVDGNDNKNKSTVVRVRAHCDHVISVKIPQGQPFKVELIQNGSDEEFKTPAEFGGLDKDKNPLLLDLTLRVTQLDNDNNNNSKQSTLDLEFHNAGWRQATLCVPSKCELKEKDDNNQAAEQ